MQISTWRVSEGTCLMWLCFLCLPLLLSDTMHPSNLWQPVRSTTATFSPLDVIIVFGGWACVASNFVLCSFKITPMFANATTSSSSMYANCCDDVAKTKLSSANLRSIKGSPPSSKSIPSVPTRIFHLSHRPFQHWTKQRRAQQASDGECWIQGSLQSQWVLVHAVFRTAIVTSKSTAVCLQCCPKRLPMYPVKRFWKV